MNAHTKHTVAATVAALGLGAEPAFIAAIDTFFKEAGDAASIGWLVTEMSAQFELTELRRDVLRSAAAFCATAEEIDEWLPVRIEGALR